MKKNIIVGQSGGPTAVINGSLYGVVSEGLKHMDGAGRIYGMINGIEGFLNGHFMDIGALDATNELELVRTTPGDILAPAAISFQKTLAIRYTRICSKSLMRRTSDISSTSAEMIPWIP